MTDAPLEARSSVHRLRGWYRRVPAHRRVGVGAFLVTLIAVLARNWWIVSSGRVEDGDFAVNSILIDSARHGQLLIGNYSRVGFNHPGPALLYVQAISQVVFHDLLGVVPRAFNAHVLGVVVFYSAIIGVSAAMVVRRTRLVAAGLLVPLAALSLAVIQPGSLVSTWFPDIYIWPFLLTTIAIASVASGEPRDLPFALAGIGFLVHGHVSFVVFAAGFGLFLAVVLVRAARRDSVTVPRRTIWISAGVVALFVLPVLLNIVLHWPGELDDYWRYSRSSEAGGHSAPDVLRFVGRYWSAGAMGALLAVSLVGATVVVASDTRPRDARRFMTATLVVVGLVTALTIFYAARGVDDLSYRYVAEFYLTAPIMVAMTVGIGLLARNRTFHRSTVVACCLLGVVLFAQPEQRAVYPGAPWVLPAERFLDAEVPDGTMRVMRFSLDVWPAVAGIVEESRRNGDPICIEEVQYGFLFSNALVCDVAERSGGVVIVASLPPATTDLPIGASEFEGATVNLVVLPRT